MSWGLNRGHPLLKARGAVSILRPRVRLTGTDQLKAGGNLVASLTRWVLAHKRTVVISWILLTIAGIMAAGPASRALNQKFSVPKKEGWETNQAIAAKYNGTGGDTSPLLPVVTLPAGKSVDSPQVKSDLTKLDDTLAKTLPGSRVASYASTGDKAFVSNDGHTTFAIVYPRPDPDSSFGDNPQAAKDVQAA